MENLKELQIEKWFERKFEKKIYGRYITLPKIEPLIKDLSDLFRVKKTGTSFLGKTIYSVALGTGKIKILLWSQMHGNETSGTKAIFDLFNFMKDPDEFVSIRNKILDRCELLFIPLLNPDGAETYTRVNAQQIDLNRDAIDLKAPESSILKEKLEYFNPQYCFNLHDQRSLFTAGPGGKTATLSFLAPSEGEDRAVTEGRKETMRVIVAMEKLIRQYIPGHVGRYTDEFYPTATGDNFQKKGHHTVLIESGHYPGDYQREKTRKYTFMALLQGLYSVASGLESVDFRDYFKIPVNKKEHFDMIFKDIFLKNNTVDVGIQYKEVLKDQKVRFIPEIRKIGDLSSYSADKIVKKTVESFKNESDFVLYIKKYTDKL